MIKPAINIYVHTYIYKVYNFFLIILILTYIILNTHVFYIQFGKINE